MRRANGGTWHQNARRTHVLAHRRIGRGRRLVSIHPFPNGNGRHARLIADVLVEMLGFS